MRSTAKLGKAKRQTTGRLRPHFDRLEPRLALSGLPTDPNPGAGLAIVATSPATSDVLELSPTRLSVRFDRPIDDFSLGNEDFRLVHVDDDGRVTPLGASETKLNEAVDASADQVDLTLTKPLVPGHYRLLLSNQGRIQGLDGSSIGSSSANSPLSDFTVGPVQDPSRDRFAGANDLETLGPVEVSRSGVLDLRGNPGAVVFEKFQVAPGHRWRVGLALDGPSEGATLSATLSLFDQGGRLIATTSQGVTGDPGRRELFQGLDPGLYYVGISAQGNIPRADGTYDASEGSVASQEAAAVDGGFQLKAVADPADRPTSLLGLRVDAVGGQPIGLTIQFDGAIRTVGLDDPRQPALMVVDSAGETIPLFPTNYDASTGQLSLVFARKPGPGTYTLAMSPGGQLRDLAGEPPVGTGMTGGELGSFSLDPTPETPGDLDPLFPVAAVSGVSLGLSLPKGGTTTVRLTIILPGTYAVSGLPTASGSSYTLSDASGVAINLSWEASTGQADAKLNPGTYTLVLVGEGDVAIQVRRKDALMSSLLESGVGQGPALGSRLISPDPNFGRNSSPIFDPSTSPSSSVSPSPRSIDPSTTPRGPSSETRTTGGVGGGWSTSTTTQLANASPLGRPSAESNAIGVVGLSSSSGYPALASNGSGMTAWSQGLSGSRRAGKRPRAEEPAEVPDDSAEGSQRVDSGSTFDSGVLGTPEATRLADDRALAEANWAGRVASSILRWWEGGERAPADTTPEVSEAVSRPGLEVAGSVGEEAQREVASIASPVGVAAVLASVAYHYRRRLKGMIRPDKNEAVSVVKNRTILRGPHRRRMSAVR